MSIRVYAYVNTSHGDDIVWYYVNCLLEHSGNDYQNDNEYVPIYSVINIDDNHNNHSTY